MSIIDEDIKNGKLNHIYLIYGDESFLRKQYKERLKKALSPEEDSMNYSYFEGKDISVGEVISKIGKKSDYILSILGEKTDLYNAYA